MNLQQIEAVDTEVKGFEYYNLLTKTVHELCEMARGNIVLLLATSASTSMFGTEADRRAMLSLLDEMLEQFAKIVISTGMIANSDVTKEQARQISASLIEILSQLK